MQHFLALGKDFISRHSLIKAKSFYVAIEYFCVASEFVQDQEFLCRDKIFLCRDKVGQGEENYFAI